MPNVMVALSNIGGALYSTPQSLADAHYNMPCSNAAKTRNQVNKFFSDCRYMPQLRRYSPTKLCDGAQMAIFGDFFASCIFQRAACKFAVSRSVLSYLRSIIHFRPAF